MGFFDWLFGKNEVKREVEETDGEIITTTIYGDGSFSVESEVGEPFKTYFRLSDEIKNARDVEAKLAACEASYEILPKFVRAWLKDTDKLPDTIMCRDVGVELYLRLGRWDKARSAIKKCIKAGAYADGGRSALDYFERYKTTAELAIKFLKENAGFLQNKIYKALPEADKDCLKSFVRSSQLIRKEKAGKTNKLYLREDFA